MFTEASAKRGLADRSPLEKPKVTFSRPAYPERPLERGAGGRPETDVSAPATVGGRVLEQPSGRPAALDKQSDRLSLLEAQMKTLQKGISRSTEIQYKLDQMASHQQKQTREWDEKQSSLDGQLYDVQEECRRLRNVCTQAERKTDEIHAPALSRASSVQGFTTNHTFSADANLSSITHHQHTSPLANSTLLTSKHLSTSNTSLESVKSTQSLRETSSVPLPYKPASSYRSSSHSSSLGLRAEGKVSTEELEKANSKIRQLQREVAVLEQQLADKSRSARTHVEELMKLRTSLSQEKASLTTAREEMSVRATGEASRLKAMHAEKISQMEGEMERMRRDKTCVDQEIGQLRADLKVSQTEKGSLMERVESLVSQLDQERSSHEEAMRKLQVQMVGENTRMQRLEEALQQCQRELEHHVTTVTEADHQHRGSLQQMKGEIAALGADLAHTRQQLVQKSSLASQLERELSECKATSDEQRTTWLTVEKELKTSLEESEATRHSLLHQLEHTSTELARTSEWLGESQQVGSELRQCKAELAGLQKSLLDVQRKKEGLEQSLVTCQQEKQSQATDLGRLRRQLEQATGQLGAMESQVRTKMSLHEELSRKLEEARAELDGTRAELEGVRAELAASRSGVSAAEGRAKVVERESQEALEKLQLDLSKRTQQVMEMDGMLRSHQADVTARRLQLERTLAQRQADLKARTQELEDLMTKYSDAQKVIEQLRSQVIQSKPVTQDRKLEAKTKEVLLLQEQLREATMAASNWQKEVESVRTQLEEKGRREEELKTTHDVMEAKVEELQRQCEQIHQDHLAQIQQQQASHDTLLASKEQQASSHKLQLQHLSDQERIRQEELSRCRAQVASLSAELAAERKVSEDARQQLAVMRSGLVYNQLVRTQHGSGAPIKEGAFGLPRDSTHSASTPGTTTDVEVIGKVTMPSFVTSNKGKVVDL